MRIPLDRSSVIPLYQQVATYIRAAILDGNLESGTRLPAIRKLAEGLGVSRITVENSYAHLEAEGLIAKRIGSGAYVLPVSRPKSTLTQPGEPSWPLWQQGPLARTKTYQERYYNGASGMGSQRKMINFAGGIGAPDLFPISDLGRVIQRIIRRAGVDGLTYSEPGGFLQLRQTIAQILSSQGLQAKAGDILITSGSQQALGIVVQLLLQAGDVVLTEAPTYTGALDLFRSLKLRPVSLAVDEEGMRVDRLEPLLQQYHPKLIYTIPNFHNPTGCCLSSPRRRQLLALARQYNIPILEDDYVGDLRYEGCARPSLKSLDPDGNVIYVSTFSKMLMPDFRIGYLVAHGPVYKSLVSLKCLTDLATSNLMQRSLDAYLSVGSYQSFLRKSCRIYRKRRECMLNAMAAYFPANIRYMVPQGGFFIWVTFPASISAESVLDECLQQGVSFAEGTSFYTNPKDGAHAARFNFAYLSEDDIEEGIERVGRILSQKAGLH